MPAAPSDSSRRPAIADIDLKGIAEALGDASDEHEWWYDPATGRTEMTSPYWGDDVDFDPGEKDMVLIDSYGSGEAYDDMVDFAEAVADANAANLLRRSLGGRGAFRRFRDTIHEFPELSRLWDTYASTAEQQRAVDWLIVGDYVDRDEAEATRAAQTAAMNAVLAAIGTSTATELDEAAVPDRWNDVCRALDAGHSVHVLRNGKLWAVISPRAG